MKRLTQWIDENTAVPDMENHKIGHKDCIKKLAEYEDLEEQGLLIKLPCKIGDIVYYPEAGRILEKKIVCFMVSRKAKITVFFNYQNNCMGYLLNESCELEYIGKIVFLTREEAEEELRRRYGGILND